MLDAARQRKRCAPQRHNRRGTGTQKEKNQTQTPTGERSGRNTLEKASAGITAVLDVRFTVHTEILQ